MQQIRKKFIMPCKENFFRFCPLLYLFLVSISLTSSFFFISSFNFPYVFKIISSNLDLSIIIFVLNIY